MEHVRPLTTGQRAVLGGLFDDTRPSDIARSLDITVQRISQIIDRLVQLGYVVRYGSANYPGYIVTPEGERVLEVADV